MDTDRDKSEANHNADSGKSDNSPERPFHAIRKELIGNLTRSLLDGDLVYSSWVLTAFEDEARKHCSHEEFHQVAAMIEDMRHALIEHEGKMKSLHGEMRPKDLAKLEIQGAKRCQGWQH